MENEASGVVLRFPSKRGRPKTTRPKRDLGTDELIRKRQYGVTSETLDLLLERGYISQNQHWCGIHLRWLYTLRHGLPSVSAIDPSHIGGGQLRTDDSEWRAEREQEYRATLELLTASGHAALLAKICIYNERPRFLTLDEAYLAYEQQAALDLALIVQGLDMLVAYWSRH